GRGTCDGDGGSGSGRESDLMKAIMPADHIFYNERRVVDVRDGLKKWSGYPGMSDEVEE
ncbi:hypothetical protein HK102_011119, partial [Quaeritorhiza haematococci]